MDKKLPALADNDPAIKRLQAIPRVDPITATMLVCAVGDGNLFVRWRTWAAWLGLALKQHSSGGKEHLLNISKRGDAYLRILLIHDAKLVLKVTGNKVDFRAAADYKSYAPGGINTLPPSPCWPTKCTDSLGKFSKRLDCRPLKSNRFRHESKIRGHHHDYKATALTGNRSDRSL